MKEIKSILSKYKELKGNLESFVLATVVKVEGSSYRRAGARMLIMENGDWIGGVSGGCLEGDLLKKAKSVLMSGIPKLVKYDTSENDPYQIGVGLGCKGLIDISLIPLKTKDDNNILEILESICKSRKTRVLLQIISSSTHNWKWNHIIEFEEASSLDNLMLDSKTNEALLSSILEHKHIQSSGLFEYTIDSSSNLKVFIEIILPNPLIYICGHEYDTIPLMKLSSELAWENIMVCNPSKINKIQYQLSSKVLDIKDQDFNLDNADPYTALLCMAHDYKTDLFVLSKAIYSNIPYIGLLGPKIRGEKLLQDLKDMGFDMNQSMLDKIHFPTGLDIGANQPEEIAISIIAEIIAKRENRSASFLKERSTSIHARS